MKMIIKNKMGWHGLSPTSRPPDLAVTEHPKVKLQNLDLHGLQHTSQHPKVKLQNVTGKFPTSEEFKMTEALVLFRGM
jgi:hypothetical protein